MVTIRGKVFVGLGEGGKFIALEWVEKQIKEKLGFKPYPGTLNLKIEEKESLDVIRELRKAKGILIEPPDPKSCFGKCFKAKIKGHEAAIIIPSETTYREDTAEVISPVKLRDMLGLNEGDEVSLELSI